MESNNGFLSPPRPKFYDTYDSPLSTKRERKRARSRSVPRLIRTAPALSRVYPRRYALQKPHFISFRSNTDPFLPTSRSYNEQIPLSYFDQCFTVEEKIGEGSFGEVFRVRSKDDNKCYAVKRTIQPFRNATDRELKLREVQKHELLPKHPNLVEFVSAWEEKGILFIQTELCEYSLGHYAEQNYIVPEEILWKYFADIAAAVQHLHQHDLLHLDIKPDNIFVSRERVCKLGDFGLIFDLKRDTLLTAQEGDSKYLAPEVLNSPPEKPADIFSLGVTILELATGLDVPSRGEGWHLLRSGTIPHSLINHLSPRMRHMIFWMIDPAPRVRPTANMLLHELSENSLLRNRFSNGSVCYVVANCVKERLIWICLYCLYGLRYLIWPVMKAAEVFKRDSVQMTPRTALPQRSVIFYEETPESPSQRLRSHNHLLVQRLRFDNCDCDSDEDDEADEVVKRPPSKIIFGNGSPRNGCFHYAEDNIGGTPTTTSSSSSEKTSPMDSDKTPEIPGKVPEEDGDSPVAGKRARTGDSPLSSFVSERRTDEGRVVGERQYDEDEDEDSVIRISTLERRNMRNVMSAPIRRSLRTQMRGQSHRPVPKLDFSLLDSPYKSPRNKMKTDSPKLDSNVARYVGDRGSSADELDD